MVVMTMLAVVTGQANGGDDHASCGHRSGQWW